MNLFNNSIRSRFATSFVVNLLRALLSMAAGLLIAKGLGPEDYGRFAFLLASWLAVNELLDMGSSSAFFTFLSRRKRSRRFFSYYFGWIFVQFFFAMIFVGLVLPSVWIDLIWVGEGRQLILLALLASFLQSKSWQVVVAIAESQRMTHRLQLLNLGIAVSHALVIVAIFLYSQLGIKILFALIVLEYTVAIVTAINVVPRSYDDREEVSFHELFKNYREYCLPLIPYAWVGFAYSFADRWLLQHYSGPSEQAYYGVASQIVGITLIATTSMLNVYWKETAEAFEKGDIDRFASLFQKTSRFLFMIGAMVAGMLVPWAHEIVFYTLGTAYIDGVGVLAIMLLYPVHQSLGQVGGTTLMAMGRTKVNSNIGMVSMLVSIVVAYLLLAPSEAIIPGLGMGATGLAIKMVVLQLFGVTVLLWWVARLNNWHFDWQYQCVGLGVCLLIGYLAYYITHLTFLGDTPDLLLFCMAGFLYLVSLGIVILVMPWLVGMTRDEIRAILPSSFQR